MITLPEALAIIQQPESEGLERKEGIPKTEKMCEAICAFSNDYSNRRSAGYLILGVKDNGDLAGKNFTDEDELKVANLRNNGDLLPPPPISVQRFTLEKGDLMIAEISPSIVPPVRYKGRVWIRSGSRQAVATEQEERVLSEKRSSLQRSFDSSPCVGSKSEDIVLPLFRDYLPRAIDAETLAENHRDPKEQLASLHFYDLEKDCPTNAGILMFGKDPKYFMFGAFIQYIKVDGNDLAGEILQEYTFKGALISVLRSLDTFLPNMIVQRPVYVSMLREKQVYNYPKDAIRELLLNAIMHRDYQSNQQIRIYHFSDRIEIHNPGGLYGAAAKGFPKQNDYRNPVLAETLRNLGYVNRFNRGIIRSKQLLLENGNPEPEFGYDSPEFFQVTIHSTR